MFFLFFFVSSVWLISGILIIFCILFMAGSGYSHSYFVYWGVIMNFVFSVCIKGDKSFLYFLYVLVVGEYSIPGSHVWHMSHTSLNHFISGYSFSCQGLKKEENVFNNSSRITTIKISFTCKIRSTLALITAD